MSSSQPLRQRAEETLRKNGATFPESLETLSPDAARQILHDLRVHQIELEMQNEELRQAQAALDALRARYFDLYDLAPVGYCTVNEQGLIVEANLCAASLLGVARGELARQPMSRFIGKEDADSYYLLRQRLFSTGLPQASDLRMLKNDGTPFWARLEAASAHGDGGTPLLRMVLIDITERKLADVALRDSESFVTSILDSVSAEIAVLDRDGVIVRVNQPWRRFALENAIEPGKAAPHTGVGANYMTVCQVSDRASLDDTAMNACQGIQAVLDRRLPSFSIEYPCHTLHQERWFSMIATRLEPSGLGAVISHTDITRLKQAEQELREIAAGLDATINQRTSQLRTISAQLILSEERERRLLAQDLHDNLGQMLAVIKIKLTSLEAGSPLPAVNDIVDLIDQTEQTVRMIALELSPPLLYTLGLMPTLDWLAEEMRRHYRLAVHIAIEGKPKPLGDEVQAMLFRSVRELLINVARHAASSATSLCCQCEGSRLTLVVSDNGRGFDPAKALDSQSAPFGFGLRSMQERIVNIGGKMVVDSRPGDGSKITLSVPYDAPLQQRRRHDPDNSGR